MMVKNFARSGTLEIWNGYQEFPSIELQAAGNLRAYNSRLVAQYPYLYAVLATPFYWVSGYRGLFFVNSIVFLLTVLVCYALATSLFEDRSLALNSCLVLVLATYLWEYSQAAWTHAVTVLFVTAAAYCTVRGLRPGMTVRSLYFPAAAGLLIGSGAGIRLDVILAAPALALALALGPSQRIKKTLAFCAGLGPGLAALSIANQIKFGTASPFSYGSSRGGATSGPAPYVPLVLLALVLLSAVWISRKALARRRSGLKNWAVLGWAAAILAAVVFLKSGTGLLFQLFSGVLQILVDLRFRDPDLVEPAMIRTASGAVVYIHAFKKSLLQSCAYLPIVVVPLLHTSRGTGEASWFGRLFASLPLAAELLRGFLFFRLARGSVPEPEISSPDPALHFHTDRLGVARAKQGAKRKPVAISDVRRAANRHSVQPLGSPQHRRTDSRP